MTVVPTQIPNQVTQSNGGTSSTTIIAAVAGGVGGVLVVGITIFVCCLCSRRPKDSKRVTDKFGVDGLKSEPLPPDGSIGETGLAKNAANNVQTIPFSMVEPGDQMIIQSQGPLMSGMRGTSSQVRPKKEMDKVSKPRMPPSLNFRDMKRSESHNSMPRVPSNISLQHYELNAYDIPFQVLKMGKKIGAGSFGAVYLASWNETPVAVKILTDDSENLLSKLSDKGEHGTGTELMQQKLHEEASLMASLRHPNIVQFMGIVSSPPAVVTEYCARGSLTDVLRAAREQMLNDQSKMATRELTWKRLLGMAADAATGMLHLHARAVPIIHRDLKSPNILVDSHWKVKICDFNMSRIMEGAGTRSSSLAGMNPRWLAPEVLAGEKPTMAADAFSFGVVLWELLTWEIPWSKENPWTVVSVVINGGRLPIPGKQNLPIQSEFKKLDDFISLIHLCWAQNPYDRPTFTEIVQQLRGMEGSMDSEGPDNLASLQASDAKQAGVVANNDNNDKDGTKTLEKPDDEALDGFDTHGSYALEDPQLSESFDGNGDDYWNYNNDVTASISSTAALASINPYRTLGGWGSLPQQGDGTTESGNAKKDSV